MNLSYPPAFHLRIAAPPHPKFLVCIRIIMTAHRFRFLSSWFLAASFCLSAVSPSGALTITAGFSDGAGTASVDQYQGVAGAGWAGAWSTSGTVTGAIATSA